MNPTSLHTSGVQPFFKAELGDQSVSSPPTKKTEGTLDSRKIEVPDKPSEGEAEVQSSITDTSVANEIDNLMSNLKSFSPISDKTEKPSPPKSDIGSKVKVPTTKTDATVVQQLKNAAVPPPSLKTMVGKFDAAGGKNTEPPRLLTRDQAIEKFGQPNDHQKIGGMKLWPKSTGYQAVLKRLDAYHQAAGNLCVGSQTKENLQQLEALLDRVETAVRSYHGDRDGVSDLAQAVNRERALLKQVAKDSEQHNLSGTAFSEVADQLREMELGGDGPQFQSIGRDAADLQKVLDKLPVGGGSSEAAKALKQGMADLLNKIDAYQGDQAEVGQLRKTVEDLVQRLNDVTSRPELLQGRKDGLGNTMSWAKALQIAPSLKTGLGEGDRVVNDKNVPQPLKELGKGAVNTVYVTGFQEGSKVREGVVKFDLPAFPKMLELTGEDGTFVYDAPNVVGSLGMQEEDPQLAQRSLASHVVAEALGSKVSVAVKVAVIDGSLATVMDKATGRANDKKVYQDVISMDSLKQFGQLKKKEYEPFEKRLGKLGDTMKGLGFSDKVHASFAKKMREALQSGTKQPPQASDLATMSDAGFKSAFSTVITDGGKKFTVVRLESGAVGLSPHDANGKFDPNAKPVELMSRQEFSALVQESNVAWKNIDNAVQKQFQSARNDWERSKLSELLINRVTADGQVLETAYKGTGRQVDKNGMISFERDAPLDIDYTHPSLVHDLVELQLLDFITGQLDRHQGNYFVRKNPDGSYSVEAIDGDLSWGDRAVSNKSNKFDLPELGNGNSLGLPKVIDSDMASKVMSLSGQELEDLKAKLGETMSATQIEAFEERLQILKQHINDPQKCTIIKPEDWGTDPAVKRMLSERNSSYASRELAQMEGFKKSGIPFTPMPVSQ